MWRLLYHAVAQYTMTTLPRRANHHRNVFSLHDAGNSRALKNDFHGRPRSLKQEKREKHEGIERVK